MYGIIISLGILSSLLVGERLAKQSKLDLDIFWGSSLWAIVGGVVGARIYHVVEYWSLYAVNPVTMLYIHRGGLGIYGAILGGALSLVIYFKLKKQKFIDFLDLSAVVIPLGQAIGRWGNFVNKEILGSPTSQPWGMYVPPKYRPAHLINNDMYHPVFLYESLLDIMLFIGLLLLYRRKSMLRKNSPKQKPLYSLEGFFTLAYLIGYGLIRFSTEFVRLESWVAGGINIAQVISIGVVVLGVMGLFLIAKRPKHFIMLSSINGILISFYLAYKKLLNEPLLCGLSQGCDIVQHSKYSTLLGVPLGLWGVLFYFAIFIVFYYNKGKYLGFLRKFLILWGLLFSIYLTYLEIFTIKAVCLWCLSSFVNIILITKVYFLFVDREK